jgi:hypothetical protein
LWGEDNERTQWRTQCLNENTAKAVAVPIRYGRFSTKRGAYTMVFSRLCYRGHAHIITSLVMPFDERNRLVLYTDLLLLLAQDSQGCIRLAGERIWPSIKLQ